MIVHDYCPYTLDKNLGKAYNQAFKLIGEDEWLCIRDKDTMWLTSDAGHILHEYVVRNPDAGMLTCYTNRVSPLSKMQLLNGVISEDANIRNHILLAEKQKRFLYQTTVINRDISGMCMVISKKIWNEFKFSENMMFLGTDTEYGRRLRQAGKKIVRMDGLLIWHTYRLLTGIGDKRHLT